MIKYIRGISIPLGIEIPLDYIQHIHLGTFEQKMAPDNAGRAVVRGDHPECGVSEKKKER